MTKVYDALRVAESERTAAKFAPPAASVGHGVRAQSAGELEQIRAILVGNLPDLLEEALDRLSAKIHEQSVALRRDLEQLEHKLDKRISEIEVRSQHGHNELRDQILSQSKLLTDSIHERSEQVNQASLRRVHELHESKLDRAAFAQFLRHTAEHFARSVGDGAAED
jgi:hypothetical protein